MTMALPTTMRQATEHGIFKRKYHLRAAFKSLAFVALVGGYHVYNNSGNSNDVGGTDIPFRAEERVAATHRRRLREVGESEWQGLPFRDSEGYSNSVGGSYLGNSYNGFGDFSLKEGDELTTKFLQEVNQWMTPSVSDQNNNDEGQHQEHRRTAAVDCDEIETAEPGWFTVFYSIGVLYMFLAIAIVCDEYFVEALEEISSPRHMDIGKDVAGATLMAAGGSAPELFTNLFGTFDQSEIGFGTIIGSAVFNVLLVIAMCSLCAKETLDLTWWPLFRDTSYYAVGLIVLAIFVGVSSPDIIEWWEATLLFLMYIGYVLIMWQNKNLHRSLTGKELVIPDLNEETSAESGSRGNLEAVKERFDSLDTERQGAIDEAQLRQLLTVLADAEEVDLNLDEAVADVRHGQEEEVTTWEDFAHWYRNSVFFERTKSGDDDDDDGNESLWAPLKIPEDAGFFGIVYHLIQLPILTALVLTIPDVRRPGVERWCYAAFLVSILWIGVFAYFMVGWTEIIGNTIGVPHVVMGYTVLAAGTSVPDLLSSVIVTRQGSGDMAISSSIGSNIFDITVGLPVPWLIFMAFPNRPNTVFIDSANIWISICVFLGMLVLVVMTIHCQGWRLTKTLGAVMFVFYVVFLVQAILLELPFAACV